ncbi:MAG: SMC family ATPase, partial [Selenomonadaceae bacterium]|nr:SMC family ATPase [Selenomonadaceae bacterium]
MRPLKLKMTAFGAYVKPVELDFEGSLRDEKIFLIHGATGAGKTTILDAICFALYGTASGDERDGVMMRSKGISNNIKTEVEFSFALGEKIYCVRRTLTYHPNRKGNQNQITAELKRDGQTIETQTRNVTNAITDLLGFNVKQFRQVVLLPQGEFKNFLSANSAERQPILDTLFNAALYNQIETELKRKADDAQSLFDDLNRDRDTLTARFQGVELDETTLAKFRANYVVAQKKSAERDKIFKEAQADYTSG